jgi:hypothetical protein
MQNKRFKKNEIKKNMAKKEQKIKIWKKEYKKE